MKTSYLVPENAGYVWTVATLGGGGGEEVLWGKKDRDDRRKL